MKKYFLFIIIILVALSVNQMIFSKVSPLEVPELLASSRSKEFCSCYFVLKKSEKYCLDSVLKGYPLFGYNLGENQVSFTNPLFSSTSEFKAASRFGCSFVN